MTIPLAADQFVAPADVNCCVAPRFSETAAGEIVCGFETVSVTTADAEPPGPVAVTVTKLDTGMLRGAVKSPLVLTLPAVALQLVAPEEANCCVPPSFTLAEAGEMVCSAGGGGGGAPDPKVA